MPNDASAQVQAPQAKPRKSRNGIRKRDPKTGQSVSVIPKDLLPAQVIDRYLSDEKTSEIAASYGISRSRLHQWLLEHAEDSWRKAQVARAITAMEQSKDDLDAASDPLELARAREKLRGAQWELERLFARLFGQKQEVTHTGVITVSHALQAISERRQAELTGDDAAQLPQSSILDVLEEPK